ncbi:MAG: hypothetical protein ACREX8_14960, partial [Gammaproteobacteria bacterium]
ATGDPGRVDTWRRAVTGNTQRSPGPDVAEVTGWVGDAFAAVERRRNELGCTCQRRTTQIVRFDDACPTCKGLGIIRPGVIRP